MTNSKKSKSVTPEITKSSNNFIVIASKAKQSLSLESNYHATVCGSYARYKNKRKIWSMNTFDKVYKVVSKIPKGKVLTYKKIAELAGIKNPRTVGFALHQNKNPKTIPCHRVIKSDGTLATGYVFGGMKKQKELLEEEGIAFLHKNKIDLSQYI